MTPATDTDVGLLRDLIFALDVKLTQRLDSQDNKLNEIHQETRTTNGRVTTGEGRLDVIEDREHRRVGHRRSVVGSLKWVVATLLAAGGVTSPLWLPLFS